MLKSLSSVRIFSQNYAEKIQIEGGSYARAHSPGANSTFASRHDPAFGMSPVKSRTLVMC